MQACRFGAVVVTSLAAPGLSTVLHFVTFTASNAAVGALRFIEPAQSRAWARPDTGVAMCTQRTVTVRLLSHRVHNGPMVGPAVAGGLALRASQAL